MKAKPTAETASTTNGRMRPVPSDGRLGARLAAQRERPAADD